MGRKPTKPGAIPRFRVRQRGKVAYYFYDHGGKPRRETSLGTDYGLAIKRWAELEHETNLPQAAVLTFAMVADRYMAEVAVRKASRTLSDNQKEIAKLKEFFDDPPAPLEGIQPVDVRQYMTWRTKAGTAYVRANREKALLSHIWNFARDKISVAGELEELLRRIRARKSAYKVHSTRLIVNENGRTIGVNAMSRKWAKACEAAGVIGLQFRDLRAKAATDKADTSGDVRAAQKQMGHSSVVMTEHYTRNRRGAKVTPTR